MVDKLPAGRVCCRGHPVELVLGAHIELTREPGVDFDHFIVCPLSAGGEPL